MAHHAHHHSKKHAHHVLVDHAKQHELTSNSIIYGMGNPLLDISADVEQDTLDLWGVQMNNAILAEEKHVPLYSQLVEKFPVQYSAGGATQNTIRVAQWVLQNTEAKEGLREVDGLTTYVGAIGKDEFGLQLKHASQGDGVNSLYAEIDGTPTGTCACLIKSKERSLIANLGAANKFEEKHLEDPRIQAAIKSSKLFYSSGFFLTVSPPSFMKVAREAAAKGAKVGINLAAPFIAQFFTEPLMAAISVSDFVFGNESEAKAFAEKHNLPKSDAETVAIYISQLPREDKSTGRYCIITQGADQTVVAFNGQVTKHAVPALAPEQIVDCNGAGDSFVGGFLAQQARGKSIEASVKAGHYCSRLILQVSGIVLPDHKPDTTEIEL